MPLSEGYARKLKIYLNGNSLEQVSYYKYLGLLLDCSGSYCKQKEHIRRKGSSLLHAFKILARSLSGFTLLPSLKVMKAKLIPAIAYGSIAMSGGEVELLDQI